MKNRFILILIILLSNMSVIATPSDEGKNIFTTRCAACHNVNKIMVGPALGGIDQRRPIEWIVNFVHSSQSVVKSGDAYAVALFEKFNKVPMPDHADLTAANIKNVIEYIKFESKSANEVPFPKPGKQKAGYLPLSLQKDYLFFIGYLMVVVLLIASLLFAVQLKRFQNQKMNKDDTA